MDEKSTKSIYRIYRISLKEALVARWSQIQTAPLMLPARSRERYRGKPFCLGGCSGSNIQMLSNLGTSPLLPPHSLHPLTSSNFLYETNLSNQRLFLRWFQLNVTPFSWEQLCPSHSALPSCSSNIRRQTRDGTSHVRFRGKCRKFSNTFRYIFHLLLQSDSLLKIT